MPKTIPCENATGSPGSPGMSRTYLWTAAASVWPGRRLEDGYGYGRLMPVVSSNMVKSVEIYGDINYGDIPSGVSDLALEIWQFKALHCRTVVQLLTMTNWEQNHISCKSLPLKEYHSRKRCPEISMAAETYSSFHGETYHQVFASDSDFPNHVQKVFSGPACICRLLFSPSAPVILCQRAR